MLASAISTAWSAVPGSGGSGGGGCRSPGTSPITAVNFSSLASSRPSASGERAARKRQPRLGLGDVGAGEVADLEPVAGRLEIGLEHPDLVLVEIDDRSVADHVHVGGDRLGEDVALGRAQVGAARLDPGVGGADRVADPAARIERQADRGRWR